MSGVIHVGRVPVTKSASGNGDISASRFPDCQQICCQISWLSTNPQAKMGVFLLADFLTVTKSAGRNGYFCWQISWLSTNLLAEMRGVIHVGRVPVTKSASGNGGISAGRFPDCHQICWQKIGDVFLLADFLSPNLPVEMGGISAGRNEGMYFCWQISCHQICQQEW